MAYTYERRGTHHGHSWTSK